VTKKVVGVFIAFFVLLQPWVNGGRFARIAGLQTEYPRLGHGVINLSSALRVTMNSFSRLGFSNASRT
jgi:hypothetical protein